MDYWNVAMLREKTYFSKEEEAQLKQMILEQTPTQARYGVEAEPCWLQLKY